MLYTSYKFYVGKDGIYTGYDSKLNSSPDEIKKEYDIGEKVAEEQFKQPNYNYDGWKPLNRYSIAKSKTRNEMVCFFYCFL